MEDNPTVVKVDRGENQVSPCRGRRWLPRALGYVTGDMKEFANWLKGISTSIPWRDGRSSFGRNGFLVLLLISLVIFTYILSIFFSPFFNFLSSKLQTSSKFFVW